MKLHSLTTTIAIMTLAAAASVAQAEVIQRQINADNLIVQVSNDSWQPEGFENGTTIPATYLLAADLVVDGRADEPAWSLAEEVEVPLSFGSANAAYLKAVYTDQEVFIRVRWADDDEDRQHHPWVWNSDEQRYESGPQVEDSVMLSFEAGCEWEPSLLAGYIFDFDAWHWLAARSDPLGQAVDLYGNVQDQDLNNPLLIKYQSRQNQDSWNVKFIENADPDLHAAWDGLDRVYMLQPFTDTVYIQAVPDGRFPPPFVEQVVAPAGAPGPGDESTPVPQYVPVKLAEGAGEVGARGQWEEGFWTVEFRRDRVTPSSTLNDTVFNRLVQFSVHVYDRADGIDQASESGRLFLQFLPQNSMLVKD